MKRGADAALSPHQRGGTDVINASRLRWDIARRRVEQFEKYWENKSAIPKNLFEKHTKVWLEIGAGSGWFFSELAKKNPDASLIAIERSRMRGKRLVKKAARSGLPNLAGFRGNAIPTLIHGIPSESVERVYLLYPCPWVRNSQRKNRWYVHPIMPHLVRILKKGGLLIWASDQKFYIDEAAFVSENIYKMKPLVCGPISLNPYNDLQDFPSGRTKFEQTFLRQGMPCYEAIVTKS